MRITHKLALLTNQPVLALGLRSLLRAEAHVELCAVVGTPDELFSAVTSERPELMLLDLTPEVNFSFLMELRRRAPKSKLILWVRTISPELAIQAVELGVSGILRKTLSIELTRKCLHKVIEGDLWFEKTLTTDFLVGRSVPLTRRESQLVSALAQGLKNKEIAALLGLTEATIKVYLSKLFKKVGVKDRFELALFGLKNLGAIRGEGIGPETKNRRIGPRAEADGRQLHQLRQLIVKRPARWLPRDGGQGPRVLSH